MKDNSKSNKKTPSSEPNTTEVPKSVKKKPVSRLKKTCVCVRKQAADDQNKSVAFGHVYQKNIDYTQQDLAYFAANNNIRNNTPVTSSDVECSCCAAIVSKMKALLQEIQVMKIDENLVCEHCRLKVTSQSCPRCKKIVENFLSSKLLDTAHQKQQYSQWLLKVKKILLDIVNSEMICQHRGELSKQYNDELERLIDELRTPFNLPKRGIKVTEFPGKQLDIDEMDIMSILDQNLSQMKHGERTEESDEMKKAREGRLDLEKEISSLSSIEARGKKGGKKEQGERDDRRKSERPGRGDRTKKVEGDAGVEKGDDKAGKAGIAGKTKEAEKTGKIEGSGKAGKAEGAEKARKTEGLGKADKAEGVGRGGKTESEGRGGKAEGVGKGGKTESEGRGGKAEGVGRGGKVESEGRGGKAEGVGRGGKGESDGRGGKAESVGRGGKAEGAGKTDGAGKAGGAGKADGTEKAEGDERAGKKVEGPGAAGTDEMLAKLTGKKADSKEATKMDEEKPASTEKGKKEESAGIFGPGGKDNKTKLLKSEQSKLGEKGEGSGKEKKSGKTSTVKDKGEAMKGDDKKKQEQDTTKDKKDGKKDVISKGDEAGDFFGVSGKKTEAFIIPKITEDHSPTAKLLQDFLNDKLEALFPHKDKEFPKQKWSLEEKYPPSPVPSFLTITTDSDQFSKDTQRNRLYGHVKWMIKGNEIVLNRRHKKKKPQPKPEIVKTVSKPKKPICTKKTSSHIEQRSPIVPDGYFTYQLSDRLFIDRGMTMLPSTKYLKILFLFKMIPTNHSKNWFDRHRGTGIMYYDTGEKLAEIDEEGFGKWYYKNGVCALNYYKSEDPLAQCRYVVYSSGEKDKFGRKRLITVLASFDNQGNGIVYDNNGNVRLKYNQEEGIIFDKSIGPLTRWKWHILNDPPVLQETYVEKHENIPIVKSTLPSNTSVDSRDEIEHQTFLQNQKKKGSKYKPFEIRIKVFKLNDEFSLHILDQANIYLMFRDGLVSMKLDLGMILDGDEILGTLMADVTQVPTPYDFDAPEKTASLSHIKIIVENTRQKIRRIPKSLRPAPV